MGGVKTHNPNSFSLQIKLLVKITKVVSQLKRLRVDGFGIINSHQLK